MSLCQRLLPAALVMVFAMPLLAQPTLDERTLPRPTKTLTRLVADTTGVRPGQAGPSVTWNYAFLQQRTQYTQRILRRSDLAPDVIDSFPNVQIAVVNDTTLNLFARVGTTFRLLGTVTPAARLTVSPDPYDTRPTEIVYDGTSVDTYRGTIRVQTGQILRRGGTDTLTYDGYGTLVLPSRTYTNVARLYRRTLTLDTLNQGPQTIIIRRSTQTWTYQQDTSDVELLEITQSTQQVTRNGQPVGTPFTTKTVSFIGDGSTSAADEDHTHRIAFPNPLQGATLYIDDVDVDVARIRLVDLHGAEHDVRAWQRTDDRLLVTIPNMANGVYTIMLISPSGVTRSSRLTLLR